MSDFAYTNGLDLLDEAWTSDTYQFLLLQGSGYTPDRAHQFVNQLVPGSNELSAAGYSRATAASKTRTVDTLNSRTVFDCADPSFGIVAAGQTYTAMVLFRFVSDDSDSLLIAYYDITDTATSGVLVEVPLNTLGVAYITGT